MTKDVIYAGMAQMAYLNWDNIAEGTDVYSALYNQDGFNINPDNLNVRSRHLFSAYSIDPIHEEPLWGRYFDGWELYYAASDIKLYRDLFSYENNEAIDSKLSNGFYGVAFINRDERKVIIAYRGTDDIADKLADVDICLLNKYNPQLTCTYWMLQHVKKKLEADNLMGCYIDFTGHSLGGALAQFAHVINQNAGRTVTWNTLGIGVFFLENFIEDTFINNLTIDICRNAGIKYSQEFIGAIKNRFHSTNKLLNNTKAIYDEIYYILLKNSKMLSFVQAGIDIAFSFAKTIYTGGANLSQANQLDRIKMATAELTGMLKCLALFRMGMRFSKNISEYNIDNYVFPDDWTVGLQTKIGKVWDVTTGERIVETIDDSVLRVIRNTFLRFGFTKHSVGNFILYMNKNGDLSCGEMREEFIENWCELFFYDVIKRRYAGMFKKKGNNEYVISSDKIDLYDVFPRRLAALVDKELLDELLHKKEVINAVSGYSPTIVMDKILYGRYNNMIIGGRAFDSSITIEEERNEEV